MVVNIPYVLYMYARAVHPSLVNWPLIISNYLTSYIGYCNFEINLSTG